MRVVIQRVKRSSVHVDNQLISSINEGLCVLLGINREDDIKSVDPLIKKIMTMKLFAEPNSNKEWKESLTNNSRENGLELMLVSQFTLDAYFKGAKPDFHKAMGGPSAKEIFDHALETAGKMHPKGPSHVKTGQFGAMMEVGITNDGPVTIIYEYPQKKENSGEGSQGQKGKGGDANESKKEKKKKGPKGGTRNPKNMGEENNGQEKQIQVSDKVQELKIEDN